VSLIVAPLPGAVKIWFGEGANPMVSVFFASIAPRRHLTVRPIVRFGGRLGQRWFMLVVR
jgi:hypothetical protein